MARTAQISFGYKGEKQPIVFGVDSFDGKKNISMGATLFLNSIRLWVAAVILRLVR